MNAHLLLEEVDAEGDVSVLRLTRPVLSTRAAQAICVELSRLAGELGRSKLHLDFGGVEYLGAGGLKELLALHRRLLGAGGGLRFCSSEGCFDLARLGALLGTSTTALTQPA